MNKPIKGPLKTVVGAVAVLIIAVGVLGIIGSALSNNSSHGTPSSDTTPPASSPTSSSPSASTTPTTPGLSQPANDGKFQFTVTSFACGQPQLTNDNEFETATAQGQFCVLKLSIKNIGTEAQQFDASSQYVYTSDGKQLSYSSNGTTAANTSGDMCYIYQTVNPGNTLACNVAFDVATGIAPTYAILHDSSFSGGVKVNLQ